MTTELHDIINPATEKVIAQIPSAGVAETDEAVARAVRAQQGWRAVAPADRGRLLRRFAEQVDAHSAELAALETAGSGHPVGAATWEAGQVRDVLMYYAAAPERDRKSTRLNSSHRP